ncbi:MAG: hypothetical protein ACKPHU_34140, partial [Planctomycetaceae bacterium]
HPVPRLLEDQRHRGADSGRWFQVVMGQKFEFDEAASEELAQRVPLPLELARQLTFDLTRWRPEQSR